MISKIFQYFLDQRNKSQYRDGFDYAAGEILRGVSIEDLQAFADVDSSGFDQPTQFDRGIMAAIHAFREKLTARQKCPACGAFELPHNGPHTVYECESRDYDQRPGSFVQSEKCKGISQLSISAWAKTDLTDNEPENVKGKPDGFYILLSKTDPQPCLVRLYAHVDFNGVRHIAFGPWDGAALMPVWDLNKDSLLLPACIYSDMNRQVLHEKLRALGYTTNRQSSHIVDMILGRSIEDILKESTDE